MGKFKLTKTKILSAVIALAFVPTIVAAQLSPVLDTSGLFQIANRSLSANWGTTTSADPGQTIDFMVHIHNNVINTTANNVKVQVALPVSAVTSYVTRATVSADNASPVSATTSFTLSKESTVTYIAGSTLLYDHNDKLIGNLPDGITGGGVKVSDGIQGCYTYEEWVIFKAKVTEKVTPTPTPVTPTPVTPTTPTTPVVTASATTPVLPVTGPADAAAGVLATLGIGGAGYAYRKSLVKLKNSFKKF